MQPPFFPPGTRRSDELSSRPSGEERSHLTRVKNTHTHLYAFWIHFWFFDTVPLLPQSGHQAARILTRVLLESAWHVSGFLLHMDGNVVQMILTACHTRSWLAAFRMVRPPYQTCILPRLGRPHPKLSSWWALLSWALTFEELRCLLLPRHIVFQKII